MLMVMMMVTMVVMMLLIQKFTQSCSYTWRVEILNAQAVVDDDGDDDIPGDLLN